jgi:hypothetical protein
MDGMNLGPGWQNRLPFGICDVQRRCMLVSVSILKEKIRHHERCREGVCCPIKEADE